MKITVIITRKVEVDEEDTSKNEVFPRFILRDELIEVSKIENVGDTVVNFILTDNEEHVLLNVPTDAYRIYNVGEHVSELEKII